MYYDENEMGRCISCDARTNTGAYCDECRGYNASDSIEDLCSGTRTGRWTGGTKTADISDAVARVYSNPNNPVRLVQEGNSIRHLPVIGEPPCTGCSSVETCRDLELACLNFVRYTRGTRLGSATPEVPAPTADIFDKLFNSGDDDES